MRTISKLDFLQPHWKLNINIIHLQRINKIRCRKLPPMHPFQKKQLQQKKQCSTGKTKVIQGSVRHRLQKGVDKKFPEQQLFSRPKEESRLIRTFKKPLEIDLSDLKKAYSSWNKKKKKKGSRKSKRKYNVLSKKDNTKKTKT